MWVRGMGVEEGGCGRGLGHVMAQGTWAGPPCEEIVWVYMGLHRVTRETK